MLADFCLILNSDCSVNGTLSAEELAEFRVSKTGSSVSDQPLREGGCYMLYNPLTKLVKVGRSGNLMVRWRAIETQSGMYLHPLAFITTPDYVKLEAELHARFSRYRRIGEWFDADPVREWLEPKYAAVREDDLLTIEQVGEYLHASRATVFRLLKDERIVSIKVGNKRVVRRKALNDFVREAEKAARPRSGKVSA